MNDYLAFKEWAVTSTGIDVDEFELLKLDAAFDLYVSRLEVARARGADDPLTTISPKPSKRGEKRAEDDESPRGAGGNSRACTRRMLAHLDYTRAELRVVHRLMGGSASGWPGLIRLYAEQSPVSAAHREYVRRQVHLVNRRSAPCA